MIAVRSPLERSLKTTSCRQIELRWMVVQMMCFLQHHVNVFDGHCKRKFTCWQWPMKLSIHHNSVDIALGSFIEAETRLRGICVESYADPKACVPRLDPGLPKRTVPL